MTTHLILSYENIHHHGNLFGNYMRARHRAFIQVRGWDLPEENGMEFDQYDTPQSRWVVLSDEGSDEVLAGFRLTPTLAQCGMYSYMIRDAKRGLLASIPPTIIEDDAPQKASIWECSRAFVADSLSGHKRHLARRRMIEAFVPAALSVGAVALIGLTDPSWKRWLPIHGLTGEPAGPVVIMDEKRFQTVIMRAA